MFRRHSLNLANWALALTGLLVALLTVATLPTSQPDTAPLEGSLATVTPVVDRPSVSPNQPSFSILRDTFRTAVPQNNQSTATGIALPSVAPASSRNTRSGVASAPPLNRTSSSAPSMLTIGTPTGGRPEVTSPSRGTSESGDRRVKVLNRAPRVRQLNQNTLPKGMSPDF